ncbi:MAG TPA: hypothetical protein VF407_24545 [Polyangiaceae bacterium]
MITLTFQQMTRFYPKAAILDSLEGRPAPLGKGDWGNRHDLRERKHT